MNDWSLLENEWDINTNDNILESKVLKRYAKNLETHYLKARQLSDIAPIPKPGDQYLIITEKQFNAFAMIVNLIEQNIIDELYLAIYRINEPTVQAIIDFIEAGKIKKGIFVISNFFNQTKKPEQWAIQLREYCNTNINFQHIYTWNHAKVLAAKVKDNYYVFEGSGNMSDNARIEQYRYENNRDAFDFHKNWMSKLVSE